MFAVNNPMLSREIAGLKFPNPVGLGAGFDKNALVYNEMGCLGFGFVEAGTVTPLAQKGNPKPRLFRLPADEALINRMGFNNDGAEKIAERITKNKPRVIIGGNIGKNKDTPVEDAISDYRKCFIALYDSVDFFVINVSSPNTPGLRDLQDKEPLKKLLSEIQALNQNLTHDKIKPVFLKIAPDLANGQMDDIIEIVKECKISGIIATNTTLGRNELKTDVTKLGNGGLSGKPLMKRSTEVVKYIHQKSNGTIPIIASGGIHSVEDALEKFNAGASLIELYTGFIYEGPMLIKKINKELLKKLRINN